MPNLNCSKEDFYKSNVLPSLHVIASLTFQDIPDKKLPLIILLSRLSEMILTYYHDVEKRQHSNLKPNSNPNNHSEHTSSFTKVYKHFSGTATYNDCTDLINNINRIYEDFRNPAQHDFVTLSPSDSNITEAYNNFFELVCETRHDFCNTLLKTIFNNSRFRKHHTMYCLLYCHHYSIDPCNDLFMDLYKTSLAEKFETYKISKKTSKDIVSGIDVQKYNAMLKIGDKFLQKLKDHVIICEAEEDRIKNINTYFKYDPTNQYLHMEQMFLK